MCERQERAGGKGERIVRNVRQTGMSKVGNRRGRGRREREEGERRVRNV